MMLRGGGVIAVRFVHPGGEVKSVGLCVGVGVAVFEEEQEDREGFGQLAGIDVRFGGLHMAAQVFPGRLVVDV